MKLVSVIFATLLLTSCGTTKFVKTYDRSKIVKGFTQTQDALADARKYTQDAKEEVRELGSNAKRIDNKASVILENWYKAK